MCLLNPFFSLTECMFKKYFTRSPYVFFVKSQKIILIIITIILTEENAVRIPENWRNLNMQLKRKLLVRLVTENGND